jgi:meso-butanediol dehydrogenase/(S,S)-butanediol dehydrogenase/diacetyl reductase
VELTDRVALVTGGARGIGRGVAIALARAGANVAIADLLSNADIAKDAELAAQEVSATGRRATLIDCDVSSEASCNAMVAQTLEQLGRLDVLVPNAGIPGIGTVLDTSAEQWERVLSVNTTGTFLTCRAALPHLVEQGEGSIVNIASTLGLKAVAGRASYVASKFAVIGLTKALAAEVAASGVRVNCVCPSSVRSHMTLDELMDITGIDDAEQADSMWTSVAAKRLPLGRSVEPDDIGQAVVWLCESDMVSGIAVPVTGGEGL